MDEDAGAAMGRGDGAVAGEAGARRVWRLRRTTVAGLCHALEASYYEYECHDVKLDAKMIQMGAPTAALQGSLVRLLESLLPLDVTF